MSSFPDDSRLVNQGPDTHFLIVHPQRLSKSDYTDISIKELGEIGVFEASAVQKCLPRLIAQRHRSEISRNPVIAEMYWKLKK